jgi:hypothetical protein
VPDNIRPVLPVVKAAAAVGLLSITRFPAAVFLGIFAAMTVKGPDQS